MEEEAMVQEQSSLESQLVSLKNQINTLTSEVDEQRAKVDALQKIHDESLAELKLIHAKMKECDTQISGFVTEQEKCLQKLSDMKLERKKLENEVTVYVAVFMGLSRTFTLRALMKSVKTLAPLWVGALGLEFTWDYVLQGPSISTDPAELVKCKSLGSNASKIWVNVSKVDDAKVWSGGQIQK